jgi:hypothetical protein
MYIDQRGFRGHFESLSTVLFRFFKARNSWLFGLSEDELVAELFLFHFRATPCFN